jgi:hypothetical protein
MRASLLLVALDLSACAVAPVGRLPANCSGVPGDLRSPSASASRAAGEEDYRQHPFVLTAVARPATSNTIPLLYAFDDAGAFVTDSHPYAKLLDDPAFVQVRKEAFWLEAEGDGMYWIPWLDKCSQASMLDRDLDFRAPPSGILFVQYVAWNCAQCDALTGAVTRFIEARPDMQVRWVQVRVPGSVGRVGNY